MMNGIDRIVRIGFTNDVTTPRISDTSSSGTSFSVNSSGHSVGPLEADAVDQPRGHGDRDRGGEQPAEETHAVSLAGLPGQLERLDDVALGVLEVPDQEVVRRVEPALLEQPHQRRVGVGLVVGVAAQPVDLGERELELEDEVLLHRDQPRRPGQADQGDVEVEVPLVELLVGRVATRSRRCRRPASSGPRRAARRPPRARPGCPHPRGPAGRSRRRAPSRPPGWRPRPRGWARGWPGPRRPGRSAPRARSGGRRRATRPGRPRAAACRTRARRRTRPGAARRRPGRRSRSARRAASRRTGSSARLLTPAQSGVSRAYPGLLASRVGLRGRSSYRTLGAVRLSDNPTVVWREDRRCSTGAGTT